MVYGTYNHEHNYNQTLLAMGITYLQTSSKMFRRWQDWLLTSSQCQPSSFPQVRLSKICSLTWHIGTACLTDAIKQKRSRSKVKMDYCTHTTQVPSMSSNLCTRIFWGWQTYTPQNLARPVRSVTKI